MEKVFIRKTKNMKYIKKFDSHEEYEGYIGSEAILPNVSFCGDVNDLHYNPRESDGEEDNEEEP